MFISDEAIGRVKDRMIYVVKQNTAYEVPLSHVGAEKCIRGRSSIAIKRTFGFAKAKTEGRLAHRQKNTKTAVGKTTRRRPIAKGVFFISIGKRD